MRPLIIVTAVLAVIGGLFFLTRSKIKESFSELLLDQVQSTSSIKANLIDVRVNIVNLTKLDPNKSDFQENRDIILNQIKTANESLRISLETYREDQRNIRSISIKKLMMARLNKKYGLKGSVENTGEVSGQIEVFTKDLETAGQVTSAIYNIYFPGDYEKYNIDLSGYYEGELQNKHIFTDVKDQVAGIDQSKFKTDELTHRLEELQIIFEDCLDKIGKESIAFSDLAECEDALSMPELKELAYFVELSYINTDSFLKTLADLTNEAYALDAAVSGMMADYEKNLD